MGDEGKKDEGGGDGGEGGRDGGGGGVKERVKKRR